MAQASVPAKPLIARRIAQRLSAGVKVHDEDPMEGGISVANWLRLWVQINQPTGFGWMRIEWPDGGCLLDQPAIAIEMLDLVGEQFMKEAQAQIGKHH